MNKRMMKKRMIWMKSLFCKLYNHSVLISLNFWRRSLPFILILSISNPKISSYMLKEALEKFVEENSREPTEEEMKGGQLVAY